jgi:hypothetical protein
MNILVLVLWLAELVDFKENISKKYLVLELKTAFIGMKT